MLPAVSRGWFVVGKKRRAVTIDESLDSLLRDREDINVSGLVNDLLRQHFEHEGDQVARLISKRDYHQQRAADLRDEIEERKRKLEQERQRIDELDQRLDELRETGATFEEAREALRGVPLSVENPAIQNWAEKLAMTPDELVTKLGAASGMDTNAGVAADGGDEAW